MRLGLSQCKAAHESAALRGLRRSLRSSSSSSSPSSSSASSRCIKLHLQAPQSLSTSSAPSSSSSSSLLCVKSHKRHRVKLASDAEKKSAPIVAIEAWKAPPPPPPPSLRRQRSLDLTSIRAPIPSRTLCRTSSCTTIGRKRVIGCFDDHEYSAASCFPSDLDEYLGDGRRRLEEKDEEEEDGEVEEEEDDDDEDESPRKRFASLKLLSSCLDRSSSIVTSADLLSSPCTPASLGSIDATQSGDGDSLLEDLPFDILIRIVCCLEHDDLKPVSQVCKHLFQAVSSAWQTHFCFTTPRREKRGLMKFELFPEEPRMGAPSHRNRGAGTFVRPPTPQAPRQPPRPAEGRISDLSEACPFPHPSSSSSSSSSVNPLDSERMKPLSMPFHRVLFSEDELCQAVAENILS